MVGLGVDPVFQGATFSFGHGKQRIREFQPLNPVILLGKDIIAIGEIVRVIDDLPNVCVKARFTKPLLGDLGQARVNAFALFKAVPEKRDLVEVTQREAHVGALAVDMA